MKYSFRPDHLCPYRGFMDFYAWARRNAQFRVMCSDPHEWIAFACDEGLIR